VSTKKTALGSQENPVALVQRVLQGEELAWQDFVLNYYGVIQAMARHFAGGDQDLADELTVYALEGLRKTGTDGTGFARLQHYLNSLQKFGGRSRFITWLALVVKNLFRDWFRQKCGRQAKTTSTKRATRHQMELEIQKAAPLDPERLMDSNPRAQPQQALELKEKAALSEGLGRALRLALEKLPEKCRQVLLLYYLQGLSGEEIRRIMWFSKTQRVYDELARARKLLKKEITSTGFTSEAISQALEFLRDFYSENIFSDFTAPAVGIEREPEPAGDG
jgi:RNA polymerase sigma factor (sigma-70 family)